MYRLFVFIFQFIFLCTEHFPSICGNMSLLLCNLYFPRRPCRWTRLSKFNQRSQSWLFRQQFGSDSACHFLLRMLNFDRIRGMQSGRIRPALLCNLCFQNACFCSVPTSEGSKSGFSSAAISYSKRAGEEKQ